MPRSFDFSVACPVSVEQIHAAFSQELYWQARLADIGGVGKLDSFAIGIDGDVHVVIVQDVRHDVMPALFAKLYPRDLEVVQRETWSLIGHGLLHGDVSTIARGAPGSAHGTVLLAPDRDGAQLNCTATVDVKVPLVGGKLESLFGRQTVQETPAMLCFTAKWISQHA